MLQVAPDVEVAGQYLGKGLGAVKWAGRVGLGRRKSQVPSFRLEAAHGAHPTPSAPFSQRRPGPYT